MSYTSSTSLFVAAALVVGAGCDSGTPETPSPPAPVEVTFAPAARIQVYSPRGLSVGDIDGDGRPDIGVVSPRDPATVNHATIYALRGDGAGGFVSTPTVFDGGNAPSDWVAVALGDLNGDGHLDAVAGNGGSAGSVDLLRGDGLGGFAFVGARDPSNTGIQAPTGHVAIADVDGDGHPEVIAGQHFGSATAFDILADGTFGPFVQLSRASAGGEFTARGIAVADFDRDGRAEVSHGTGRGVSVTTFTRASSGISIERQRDVLVPGGVWVLAAADLDGDGDLDLATLGSVGPSGTLLLNDGSGGFQPVPFEVGPFSSVPSISAGDIDGDGDADLAIVAERRVTVYVNVAQAGAAPSYTALEGLVGPTGNATLSCERHRIARCERRRVVGLGRDWLQQRRCLRRVEQDSAVDRLGRPRDRPDADSHSTARRATPSSEDIAVTKQLVEAGKVMGIPVHDHLIIAGSGYTSLAERGMM